MTEAELWELILNSQANAATYFALFLTLASGYLVVAYMEGFRLLSSQIRIVNALFILSTLATSFATYAAFSRAAFLLDFASPEYISPASAGIIFAPTGMLVIQLALITACFVFMWQVRHPKTE